MGAKEYAEARTTLYGIGIGSSKLITIFACITSALTMKELSQILRELQFSWVVTVQGLGPTVEKFSRYLYTSLEAAIADDHLREACMLSEGYDVCPETRSVTNHRWPRRRTVITYTSLLDDSTCVITIQQLPYRLIAKRIIRS